MKGSSEPQFGLSLDLEVVNTGLWDLAGDPIACISISPSSRMTDGMGVMDRGGVKVGDTGIDRQVGTVKMFPFEIAAELASLGSKVEAPVVRQSDSSSAMGWNRKSLEWPFIVPKERGFNPVVDIKLLYIRIFLYNTLY